MAAPYNTTCPCVQVLSECLDIVECPWQCELFFLMVSWKSANTIYTDCKHFTVAMTMWVIFFNGVLEARKYYLYWLQAFHCGVNPTMKKDPTLYVKNWRKTPQRSSRKNRATDGRTPVQSYPRLLRCENFALWVHKISFLHTLWGPPWETGYIVHFLNIVGSFCPWHCAFSVEKKVCFFLFSNNICASVWQKEKTHTYTVQSYVKLLKILWMDWFEVLCF